MMSPIPGDNRQDPHNPNHDDLSLAAMDTNIIIAAGSSSESAEEDEDDGYQGYQMLPQDPLAPDMEDGASDDDMMDANTLGAVGGGVENSSASDDSPRKAASDADGGSRAPSYMQVPHIDNQEVLERKSLWSQSRLQPQEPMDEDHMNKIKSAMSGFSLPGCQIPTWARVISEDDWKAQLLGRLQGQVSLLSPSQSTVDNDSVTEERSMEPQEHSSQSDPPNKRARCSLDDSEVNNDEEKTSDVGEKVAAEENPQGNGIEER